MKLKIGITGINGFLGFHLKNTLKYQYSDKIQLINFDRDFFKSESKLNQFLNDCDFVFHLAAINRNKDEYFLYNKNIELAQSIVNGLKKINNPPNLVFSSSIQENVNTVYGNSKKKCGEIFEKFYKSFKSNKYCKIIIPNIFGPFANPNYNSVFATFSTNINNKKDVNIIIDNEINFIYVDNVVSKMIKLIFDSILPNKLILEHDFKMNVSDLKLKLEYFSKYIGSILIPEINLANELNIFNSFRSYLKHPKNFCFNLNKNVDNRGSFIELARHNTWGQFSFSTTMPGITRGNHFHTRKYEKFFVLKGKAIVRLQKIDSKEIVNFELDGQNPKCVDIPVWYAHNITNVGQEELITAFWINEPYNEADPDTYKFEINEKN